jgi:hypothetical protein
MEYFGVGYNNLLTKNAWPFVGTMVVKSPIRILPPSLSPHFMGKLVLSSMNEAPKLHCDTIYIVF